MRSTFLLLFLQLWGNVQVSSSQNGRQCVKLDVVNAYITRNSKETYSHDERVRYACVVDNENTFTVTCEHGTWTGIQSCPACPRAEVPHGFVVGPLNDMAYFACDSGYKLFTKGWWGEATCKDHVWSGLEECIEERKCGEIPVIPNGGVTHQRRSYAHGERVQVTCKEGFQCQVDSLTCSEGKWTSDGVSLTVIYTPAATNCSAPPKVDNAVVTTSYMKEYLSESEVTYKCRDTYAMEGENTLRCTNGEWETKDIRCTNAVSATTPRPTKAAEERCTVTSVMDSVLITTYVPNNIVRKGQKLAFVCRYRGQFLRGNAEVQCLAGGQWSAPFPTCAEPMGCGRPPVLLDGDTRDTARYRYRPYETVEYVCQNLYTLEGESFKTCINGEWVGQMRCLRACTVDREAMRNHNIEFRYGHQNKLYSPHGDEIEFRCTGYSRHYGRLDMRQVCFDGVMNLPTCF